MNKQTIKELRAENTQLRAQASGKKALLAIEILELRAHNAALTAALEKIANSEYQWNTDFGKLKGCIDTATAALSDKSDDLELIREAIKVINPENVNTSKYRLELADKLTERFGS